MPSRIPYLFYRGVVTGLILFVLGAAVIGAGQNLEKGKAYLAYPSVIESAQNNVKFAADNLLTSLVSMTTAIEQTNSQLEYCSLPLDSTDYYANFYYLPLIQLMNSFAVQNSTAMQSIGIISVDEAGTPQADFSNKVSCEIALDTFNLGCPEYVYACTDNSTNFLGFCASANGAVDLTKTVYDQPDTGLTPQEISFFNNPNAKGIFLPIFNLLGQFSLTYERSHWCPGGTSAYAVTIAQKNLNQLTSYLSTLTIGLTGVAYLIEKETGYLIATSVDGEPLVNSQNARIVASNATNGLIRKSARFLTKDGNFDQYNAEAYFDPRYDQTDGLLIDIRPYEFAEAEATLNWLTVVAVPESDYAGWTSGRVRWSILIGFMFGLALLLVAMLLDYYLVHRSLVNSNVPAHIAEIQKQRETLVSK